MIACHQIHKTSIILFLFLFFISCGSDIAEDIIDVYESGKKKVYVRFHPSENVLEKHFYNTAGEMVHIERDSLSYRADLEKFMIGTWIIDKMTVDGEITFEKDSIIYKDNVPNIYTFTDKKLLISGPQYNADYDIQYLDSLGISFEGVWTYDEEGKDTYRTKRIYDIDYFNILSYYTFIWSEFLEDEEKEEEVIFRRINFPLIIHEPDSLSLPDSLSQKSD